MNLFKSMSHDLSPQRYQLSAKAMALAAILSFSGLQAAPAEAMNEQSLRVTLNVANMTVADAISKIERSGGYVFVYNDDVRGELSNKVTLRSNNKQIDDVLRQLFASTNIAYRRTGRQVTLYKAEQRRASKEIPNSRHDREKQAVGYVVTGKVVDNAGEPVVGATVRVKGRNIATVSNVDGFFTIDMQDGKALDVSYVGYHSQTINKPKGKITVVLAEDNADIAEVVVVGYGVKKKANLIGAVSTVTADELKDRPVSSVGQMLQGQVPNLTITFASGTPGEATRMNIRGATSIVNSGAPLVLIDGVEGNIDRVNPNDIESISVLKDAASAAIYGARAGFGVILVTTKSNKDGQVHITYNGRYSWSAPTTKTSFMTCGYDAARLVDQFSMAMNNSSYTNYSKADYAELKARRYDQTENPNRSWVVVGPDGNYRYYGNFDWYHYIFDFKQPTWNHNLSISGGSNKFNFVVSANYNQRLGIFAINPDRYNQKNFMAKVSSQLKPWLKLTSTSTLFRSDYAAPGYDFEDGGNFDNLWQHALPYVLPCNPDGSNVYTYSPSANKPTNGFVAMLREGKGFANVKKTQSCYAVNADFKISEDLHVIGNVSYKLSYKDKTTRQANMTYSEKPEKYDKATTIFFQNRLKESRSEEEYLVYDLYANYQKTFSSIHSLNIVAGVNHETGRYKNIEGNVKDLPMSLNDLFLGTGARGVKGGQHEYALLGYFGRLSYDCAGKYLAELNMRYDGTSRFPKQKRWGFFPSVALGWRMSDENFFSPLRDVVENLKLRFSIGSLGNQITDGRLNGNPYYPYIRKANIKQSNFLNYIADDKFFYYVDLAAPVSGSLTWEKIITTNVGLDLGILKNRLTATVDLYQRRTKDMLAASLTLPGVYGYSAPLENNGELRTNGYEITLSWNDRFILKGKPFYYGCSAALSDCQSKLVRYSGNQTKVLGKEYEGMEWGEIWGYKVRGIYQTEEDVRRRAVDQSFVSSRFTNGAGDLIFEDIDNSTKIDNGKGTLENHGDLVKLGNSLPRYQYSFTTHMSWNGFDLSLFLQGIGRQHFYPSGENFAFWGPYSRIYSSFIPADFVNRYWTKENPNSYFPRPAGGIARNGGVLTKVNNRYLQNLAYCRLKNFTIGYTLPGILTKKVSIEKIRFYFSGENMFTLSALDSNYLDPEQISGKGGSGNVYPYSKSFAFGLDVTF